jgi:nucleotide-binding universal stress UspA family protein
MFKNILIATDGSELAGRAVDYGVKLAKALDAKVCMLTVTQPFHVFAIEAEQLEETPTSFRTHMKKQAERILTHAAQVAAAAGIDAATIHLEDDAPNQAIIRAAESRQCDVIVMASHGRSGMSAMFLGSETLKVLSQSTIPVLVVR